MLTENVKDLGLVIDLTNTRRYYNSKELERKNIKYFKIFCEGRQIPSSTVTTSFFKAVEDFQKTEGEIGKLIGVHCTHGLNRTGYLICRYMIDRMNFSPHEAIQAFQLARGYPIERKEYVNSLLGNSFADDQNLNLNTKNGKCLEIPSAQFQNHYSKPKPSKWPIEIKQKYFGIPNCVQDSYYGKFSRPREKTSGLQESLFGQPAELDMQQYITQNSTLQRPSESSKIIYGKQKSLPRHPVKSDMQQYITQNSTLQRPSGSSKIIYGIQESFSRHPVKSDMQQYITQNSTLQRPSGSSKITYRSTGDLGSRKVTYGIQKSLQWQPHRSREKYYTNQNFFHQQPSGSREAVNKMQHSFMSRRSNEDILKTDKPLLTTLDRLYEDTYRMKNSFDSTKTRRHRRFYKGVSEGPRK
ncbi:uncharacterized protein LOC143229297 isoform X2 [Tachypleus tridentatus]